MADRLPIFSSFFSSFFLPPQAPRRVCFISSSLTSPSRPPRAPPPRATAWRSGTARSAAATSATARSSASGSHRSGSSARGSSSVPSTAPPAAAPPPPRAQADPPCSPTARCAPASASSPAALPSTRRSLPSPRSAAAGRTLLPLPLVQRVEQERRCCSRFRTATSRTSQSSGRCSRSTLRRCPSRCDCW